MPDLSSGTQTQRDAYQTIYSVLQQYDLTGLADWAWNGLISGQSEAAVSVDLFNQQAFKDRFPVIDQRRQAGLPPVSAADVLAYEDGWKQLAIRYDLPPSFASRQYAQGQLLKNRTLVDADRAVATTYMQVKNSAPEVRDAFGHFFGAYGDTALLALSLDADHAAPELELMVGTAQIAGAGQQHGFTLDQAMADRLARLGINYDQAQTGFGQLEDQKALFTGTIDEQHPVTATTGIEAQFGTDAGAADQVRKESEARQAAYSGRSDVVATNDGLIGAGSARSV